MKFELGIDVENPWEYYGTDNINDIPIHLRKIAREFKERSKCIRY